jgi:acetyl/propionyl-CoA carboxylase alpha subunit
LIAEDVLAGFLPSSGTITQVTPPRGDVRVDTALRAGGHVPAEYDSLLAKVIAHGATRAQAIERLTRALRGAWIDGVSTTLDLQLAILEQPAFSAGDLHTDFLAQHHIVESLADVPAPVLAAVTGLDNVRASDVGDPWLVRSGWRLGRVDQPAAWLRAGRSHVARVSEDLPSGDLTVQSEAHPAGQAVRWLGPDASGTPRVSVDGAALSIHLVDDDRRWVAWQGHTYRLERAAPPGLITHVAGAATQADGRLTAPMPGRVLKIDVIAGDRVTPHQPLLVLEAMKMEHVVEAPHAGVIAKIAVTEGEQVAAGASLLTVTELPEA